MRIDELTCFTPAVSWGKWGVVRAATIFVLRMRVDPSSAVRPGNLDFAEVARKHPMETKIYWSSRRLAGVHSDLKSALEGEI